MHHRVSNLQRMSRRVAIVPHTHWDREWYAPFQTFRMKLVETLDAVIDLLETDPGYRCFLLDGQMAAVDDYLEVRTEAEARLLALAVAGRITLGPWYVLMDEFLVSGETIVRNLQKGLARAAAFGGAMDVGYLPDMFGHVGQMPQILRLAGLSQAVVWRGVPSAITSTGFWWEAPDGSIVRAEYLPVGYGNGASLPDDAKAFVRRARDHCRGARVVLDRRPSLHEWVGPPRTPALAQPGGERGQRAPRRLALRDHVPSRLPCRRADRAISRSGEASCARAHVPTCSWA